MPYSPWGCKELDMTEHTPTALCRESCLSSDVEERETQSGEALRTFYLTSGVDGSMRFRFGGRQQGSRTGSCLVSKRGINNAHFSFALPTSPSSCFEHFGIFSLSIYKTCLSHYSPAMTSHAEAAPGSPQPLHVIL